MDETITLSVDGQTHPAIYQGDWMLDKFCQLRAQHYTKREAYRAAYEPGADVCDSTIDTKIRRLHEKHPEIPRRIMECAADLREKWMHRLYDGLEQLWLVFITCIDNPKTAALAMTAYRMIATVVVGNGAFFGDSGESADAGQAAIDTSHTAEKVAELMQQLGSRRACQLANHFNAIFRETLVSRYDGQTIVHCRLNDHPVTGVVVVLWQFG